MLKKIIVHNYRIFKDLTLELDEEMNIIVGDNETGKSTILEAIGLALTKRINGWYIENELSPYFFNVAAVQEYFDKNSQGQNVDLPNIFIELYLNLSPEFSPLKGRNNSSKEDCCGIRLEISFDDEYAQEYEEYLNARKDKEDQTKLIPTEYYKVIWRSFAGNALTARSIPIGLSSIDATNIRLQSGTDFYLRDFIRTNLDPKERVALSVAYRNLKESFIGEASIATINQGLDGSKGDITDKKLAIAIDVSQRTNWEANLIPHLDDLPFQMIGKGEQYSLKIMLALSKNADDTNVLLIEEPENHLSFSSMRRLLSRIEEKSNGKQIIITTHSSYVLNKLGLNKLILLSKEKQTNLQELPSDTQKYFKKLSGYDTLRLILAKKAILVEGPSDELLVQRAYYNESGKLPIDDGIDVINVRGLSFKRFLDIAVLLSLDVVVVTDNDGDYQRNIVDKYHDFLQNDLIKICASSDDSLETLETQIVHCNDVGNLNSIFGTSLSTSEEMVNYMKNNKTVCALELFETKTDFEIPLYLQDAIQ
jgi:predicted ATP-dependent endonuclease of OLD family